MSDSEEEVEYEPETFQLKEYTITITTVAYLPITMLMKNRTQEKEISGQKLWCGSLCVSNYLFQHSSYVVNKAVIELGAGTGVVSILSSKLGAAHVIATDHDKLSLDHMVDDFARNNVEIDVERLDWFAPDVSTIHSKLSSVGTANVLLLAGDVLYKAILLDPFFTTVHMLLQGKENAELLLCHIPRAGVTQEQVQEAAKSKKLSVEILPRSEWEEGEIYEYCPKEDLDRSQIYIIRCDNKE